MTAAAAMPFIVGGASAMLASLSIHPIDLAKVRLQLYSTLNPGKEIPSAMGLMMSVYQKDGIKSLYTGLSAALLRQAIYGTARIGLHRTFSNHLLERSSTKQLSFAGKAASGMGSGSLAVCVGTPMDVALVRMQADSMKALQDRRGYTNVFNALWRIAKEEGFFKLYSGLAPNVLRGMSMNVGQLACFDQAKEVVAHHMTHDVDPHNQPSLQTQLIASCIAGFTASAFSLPFDLLKSRMQDASKAYTGVVDCLMQVLRNEGVLALWTGFMPYYMRTAPHAMIILLSTAPLQRLYKDAIN